MENRRQNLDAKGYERARRIAKAAAKLFSRKGFLETTMDEIAATAKISKGGMYYYFTTKNEILFFILSDYMDLVLQDLEKDLSRMEEAIDKLKFIISRHIELYSNNLSEGKVLLHETHCLARKHYRTIAEKQRQYYEIVAGVLSDLFHDLIPKSKLTVLTFMLFGMCNWIYSWYDPKGTVSPQELSEMIYKLFLSGVRDFAS